MPTQNSNSLIPLSNVLDKKLLAYVAAASAAGVGLLTQPAEGKVVITKANQAIDFQGRTKLDLNNDGIPDFNFNESGLGHIANDVIHPLNSNHVVGASGGYWAAALPAGATVGPGAKFVGHVAVMQQLFTASGYLSYLGPWANANNLFLGLEVTVNGQKHFGWARIFFPSFGHATLLSYAYETVAGKPIATVTTADSEASIQALPNAASPWQNNPSLGLLARGAAGMELWRRDEQIM